jgi:hypothetical protein
MLEVMAELGGESGTQTRIALAVNADSMSTWFTAALGQLPDALFDSGSPTSISMRRCSGSVGNSTVRR